MSSCRYDVVGVAGANSTTTAVPSVVVGSAAVSSLGLGFEDDPQCFRAAFSASDGLLTGMAIRDDGLGCNADTTGNNSIRADVRQNFWQYIDGSGGPYCLIEQSRAVEVAPPFRVALTRGPIFQEVVSV